MRELTMTQFMERSEAFDQAVALTPDIDRFCSSCAWILPAREAFLAEHQVFFRESEHGFVALARGYDLQLGHYLHPLEASWALACPIVGTNIMELTAQFVDECHRLHLPWNLLFLSGIAPNSMLLRELIRGFRYSFSIGIGSSVKRRVASLEGGWEGFFSRRSSKFRTNLRRSLRKAEKAGIEFEYVHHIEPYRYSQELFQRALEIERRSWKGQADTGIIDSPMRVFYDRMLPIVARQEALRFVFITLDGEDIAYCFGATFGDTFRGLQMSFHDGFRRYSPGTLAQLHMIRQLCEEGILRYDLGSEMLYKHDWAEQVMETVALIVRR